jgi:hypothetical protein
MSSSFAEQLAKTNPLSLSTESSRVGKKVKEKLQTLSEGLSKVEVKNAEDEYKLSVAIK